MDILDLIVAADFAKSRKEAKRLIQGKGFKINDVVIEETDWLVSRINDKLVIYKPYGDGKSLVHPCMLKGA